MEITKEIINYLNLIKGTKVDYVCRALDLVNIGFGKILSFKNRKGVLEHVAQYSLHIQCPFRITKDNKIIIGTKDLLTPTDTNSSYADWNDFGSIMFDKRSEEITAWITGQTVLDVKINELGDLVIMLTDGAIHCFCTGSALEEEWRFFERDTKHLVVYSTNFDFD